MDKIFQSVKTKVIILVVVVVFFVFLSLNLLIGNIVYTYLKNEKVTALKTEKAAFNTQLLLYYENGTEKSRSDLLLQMRNYSIQNNSRCFLLDSFGKVKLDSFGTYEDKDLGSAKEFKKALKGLSAISFYTLKTDERVIYYASPVLMDSDVVGVFMIVSSFEAEDALLRNLKLAITDFFIIFIIVLVFLASYFWNKITLPLEQLKSFMDYPKKKIEKDDLGASLEYEYMDFVDSVNGLIAGNLELENTNKEFISNVSHELKTPIASMKILSDALITVPSDDIELYREFMNDINGELDHMTAIIKNMISLLYLEKGDYTLNLQLLNIVSIVEHRVRYLRAQASKKNIEIKFIRGENCFIRVDRVKIRQVFDNLINNAIKFTEEGGLITVEVEVSRDFIEISVQDNGKGISEDDLSKIFDKFYMADEARERVFESSGIGLSVVKQIVNLHSGSITVESEVGVGSKFIVSLPRTRL